MKKLTLISIIFLFVFLAPLQLTNAQDESDQFNLQITGIETKPDEIRVGEETKFIVNYRNSGATAVPFDAVNPENNPKIVLMVVDLNKEGNDIVEICGPQPILEDELPPAESEEEKQHLFNECTFTPTETGVLSVNAAFVPGDITQKDIETFEAAGEFNLTAEEQFKIENNANDDSGASISINILPYDSNLPDDLARVFAGLGIFFAIMAIVAVGTEVVIDTTKVALGFKSKVTANAALEKMEKYMPGQLASLGVSHEQLQEFKSTTQNLRATLEKNLEPVNNIGEVRQSISEGKFEEAYNQILEDFPTSQEYKKKTDDEIKEIVAETSKKIKALVDDIIKNLAAVFKINAAQFSKIKNELHELIDDGAKDLKSVEDVEIFLDAIFEKIRAFENKDWAAELAKQQGWLESQTESYKVSKRRLLTNYSEQVAPLLVGIGFTKDSVDGIRSTINENLNEIESNIRQASDLYVTSVRNVINAVEQRRFQTQSPARKIWRALRSWEWGALWPQNGQEYVFTIFLGILVLLAIGFAAFNVSLAEDASSVWFFWIIRIILLLTLGVLIAASIIQFSKHNKKDDEQNQNKEAAVEEDEEKAQGGDSDEQQSGYGKYKDSPVYGLYGVFVFSLLIALLIWFILWLVQPTSKDVGLFDPLTWGTTTMHWWGWTFFFFSIAFTFTFILGEWIGNYIYKKFEIRVKHGSHHTVLIKIETIWNMLHKGFDAKRVDPNNFNEPDTIEHFEQQENAITTDRDEDKFVLDEKSIAQFVLWRTDQQRDEEASRLRWLRVISFFVGLTIAYVLNIDAIALLGEAFPSLGNYNYLIVEGKVLHAWKDFFNPDRAITAGIVLTGFAASAGSTFWHDRLDQLQATKKGAETAADMLKQAQEAASK